MCSFLHQHSALVITLERVTTLWWNTVQVILVQEQSLKKKTYCTTTELGPRRCKYCTSSIHLTSQHVVWVPNSQGLGVHAGLADSDRRTAKHGWLEERDGVSHCTHGTERNSRHAGTLCPTGTTPLIFLSRARWRRRLTTMTVIYSKVG